MGSTPIFWERFRTASVIDRNWIMVWRCLKFIELTMSGASLPVGSKDQTIDHKLYNVQVRNPKWRPETSYPREMILVISKI